MLDCRLNSSASSWTVLTPQPNMTLQSTQLPKLTQNSNCCLMSHHGICSCRSYVQSYAKDDRQRRETPTTGIYHPCVAASLGDAVSNSPKHPTFWMQPTPRKCPAQPVCCCTVLRQDQSAGLVNNTLCCADHTAGTASRGNCCNTAMARTQLQKTSPTR